MSGRRVQLLYFAALHDLMGQREECVELPAGIDTLRQLAGWLEVERPVLSGRLAPVRFAIDETFAPLDATFGDGAVIALIPPVAGG